MSNEVVPEIKQRTTIYIPDKLLDRARLHQRHTGKGPSELIQEALELYLPEESGPWANMPDPSRREMLLRLHKTKLNELRELSQNMRQFGYEDGLEIGLTKSLPELERLPAADELVNKLSDIRRNGASDATSFDEIWGDAIGEAAEKRNARTWAQIPDSSGTEMMEVDVFFRLWIVGVADGLLDLRDSLTKDGV